MVEVEHLVDAQNQLGEGPVWNGDEQALYWVDIKKSSVHRFFPTAGTHQRFVTERAVTALAVRSGGGWVAATCDGFAFWDPESGKLRHFEEPEKERSHIRFNDGAVDPLGRFWAGTMNQEDVHSPDGCLYRLDPDLTVHCMARDFTVCNGIGWSPDRRRMYFTDSLRSVIWSWEFDPASGILGNRTTFVKVPREDGFPDGLAVDAEGFVWSAHWGGWRVTRYDPEGREERVVRLPAAHVTSCAFGGRDLDELYITTAWDLLTDSQRNEQHLAGGLFRANVRIRGQAVTKFAG